MEHNLTTLFKAYAEQDNPPILELRDMNNKLVGALYLDKLRYMPFFVSETNNSEKYYLYANGVGIYFSFYTKIAR